MRLAMSLPVVIATMLSLDIAYADDTPNDTEATEKIEKLGGRILRTSQLEITQRETDRCDGCGSKRASKKVAAA